jgi:hypothetical protein
MGKKGEIYNFGSGKSYSLLFIWIQYLNEHRKISVENDQNKFRPADLPEFRVISQKSM